MGHFWRRLFARFAQAEPQRPDGEFPADVLYPNGSEDVEMTAYDIRSRRFGRRLFGGLKPEEVTAFLDDVAEALDRAQRLHIEMGTQVKLLEAEVQALAGKQGKRQATAIIRQAEQRDDGAAASRVELLRITAMQEVEALLHDAHARTQALTDAANERAATIVREADELKSYRQKEADQLVADATATAELILMAARDQEVSLRHELDRLAESRLRMLDDVRATVIGCQEWLATVDPRRRGSEEGKGQLDRVA